MATCYVCDKPDGWGHKMTDHRGRSVDICRVCWRKGCERCEGHFDATTNPPVAQRFLDNSGEGLSDDMEVWCRKCHDKKGRRA